MAVKELVLTVGSCGCLRLFKRREPMRGAIITEDSSKDIWSNDYHPITSESGDFYLVPENYEEGVSEPKHISELSTEDAAALANLLRKTITVSATGATVTDAFFANTISAIGTDAQYYLADVHFTQSGTTITGINGVSFSNGQILTAYI